MTITAEISFMVFGQNGAGHIEKRVIEMDIQDYTACTDSNREKNAALKSWAKSMFPTAKDVKIQTARKTQ